MNRGVLFLCVANSARSQMAEGLARAMAPSGVTVWSAGSQPATLNPFAVAALAEVGIDISGHHSKPIDSIDASLVDTVVTLCAEEVCPVYLGSARRRHWPLSDPAGHDESEEASLRRFRAVRDELSERIRRFLIEEGVLRDGEEAK